MAQVTEKDILDALKTLRDPATSKDIVAANMVSGVAVRDGHVGFTIEVDPERGKAMEPLRKQAEELIANLPGVLSASVVLTAHSETPSAPAPAAGQTKQQAPPQGGGGGATIQSRHGNPEGEKLLGNIKAVVAVASGKGGVGKSTTAANLAVALAQSGLAVGILDADIYGPSLPTTMGISGKPESPDGKRIIPIMAHGVACMSIGFMVPKDTPMIWRGPMVMGALEQMMDDVEWGDLDIIIVDMPPGTGDAQLTMAQRVSLAGAVIVSTPQDLSLLDARKGLFMFHRVEVPVIGIVENMSYFECPKCGERSEVFAHSGARDMAAELEIPFLGEIPLHMAIREATDNGTPVVVTDPDGPHAAAYRSIAERVRQAVLV